MNNKNLKHPLSPIKLIVTRKAFPLWKRGQGGFKVISEDCLNIQSYKNPPQSSFLKGGSLSGKCIRGDEIEIKGRVNKYSQTTRMIIL